MLLLSGISLTVILDEAACLLCVTCLQDKANLERQLKQLNSRSSMLEKNLEKKDSQVIPFRARAAKQQSKMMASMLASNSSRIAQCHLVSASMLRTQLLLSIAFTLCTGRSVAG